MGGGESRPTREELVTASYAEQRLRAVEALTVLTTENPERPAGSWLRILARCQLEGLRTNRHLTVDDLVRRARESAQRGPRAIPEARSGDDH
jgi:hypothetical protein